MTPTASVHGKNACVLALALLGAIPFGWGAVGSVALGGGMQALNLSGIERGIRTTLGLGTLGYASRALLALRWVVFLGAVVAAILVLPIEPIAFIVGLSTAVPAVVWQGLTHTGPQTREC